MAVTITWLVPGGVDDARLDAHPMALAIVRTVATARKPFLNRRWLADSPAKNSAFAIAKSQSNAPKAKVCIPGAPRVGITNPDAEPVVVIVSVVVTGVELSVTEAGAKLQVASSGSPLQEKPIGLGNEPCSVTVSV